jgi:hypothetical protein
MGICGGVRSGMNNSGDRLRIRTALTRFVFVARRIRSLSPELRPNCSSLTTPWLACINIHCDA